MKIKMVWMKQEGTQLHLKRSGKRRRGRLQETWRRTLTTELKNTGKTWGEMGRIAKDRGLWRFLETALCAIRRKEDE